MPLNESPRSSDLSPQQPLLSPEASVTDWTVRYQNTRRRSSLGHGSGGESSHTQDLEPHTLEDGRDITAHSLGLSGEQDTNLLASFRAMILNEADSVDADIIQVYPGNGAGKPPLHFYMLRDAFMPYDDAVKDQSSRTIEEKVSPHGPTLVRLYFKYVHPVYCVVSKCRFLRAYKEDRLRIPPSLRGVIYGLALVFWDRDPQLALTPCPCEQWELFQAAQASLDRELDGPNLWKLQACLLMLHDMAASNCTFESPRTWTLSAQAVACAQMTGINRDPTDWSIEPWEKSLRRKLWWATFVTDTWASVSHGNPPHIYHASYTTADLDMDDLRFDEDVPDDLRYMVDAENVAFDLSTGARFLELVRLTQILHPLIQNSLYVSSTNLGYGDQSV